MLATEQSQEEVYVMGRIALDAESAATGSVKLNEASIVLESSRQMGSGVRVPLRFDPALKIRGGAKGTGAIGLFPGALVALKGRNGGGGWFLASEILSVHFPGDDIKCLLTRPDSYPHSRREKRRSTKHPMLRLSSPAAHSLQMEI
jgi:hypothetical protein